ncbi:MAG: tetratricopeptide repeat protein [Chitinivibrionales bacterium]|nr:tetratricopeptide repeat protein [Chitinivibrionales bacterium]MBD3358883.1 tetratricopeptide repeat protein [Chitinivibrionales bacterium]
MNITQHLKLKPDEIKILRKVLLISMGTSALLVGLVWTIQQIRMHSAASTAKLKHNQVTANPVAHLSNQEKLLPIDIKAHRIAATHYTRTQEPAKAIQHLLRVLAATRQDRKNRLELATAYLKAGHYQAAKKEFTKLIQTGDEDTFVRAAEARLGLTFFYLGSYEESVKKLNKCLERYPGSYEAACYRGQVLAALTPESPLVLKSFAQALSINPAYVETRYQRARYYMNKPDPTTKDYHKARMDLLALLGHEPLHAKAHSRLGMVYYYLGQHDAAQNSYRTALALNPQDYNTHYNLAEMIYLGLNKPMEALKHYKAALKIDSTHVPAHFRVGLISLADDAYNEAIVHLKKAVSGAPSNIRFRLQLAVAYEQRGMPQKAKSTYHSILKLDPLHAVARQKLELLNQDAS